MNILFKKVKDDIIGKNTYSIGGQREETFGYLFGIPLIYARFLWNGTAGRTADIGGDIGDFERGSRACDRDLPQSAKPDCKKQTAKAGESQCHIRRHNRSKRVKRADGAAEKQQR